MREVFVSPVPRLPHVLCVQLNIENMREPGDEAKCLLHAA